METKVILYHSLQENDGNLLVSECLLKGATFYSHSIIRDSFCSHKAVASNKARLTHSSGIKTAWDVDLFESWLLVWRMNLMP